MFCLLPSIGLSWLFNGQLGFSMKYSGSGYSVYSSKCTPATLYVPYYVLCRRLYMHFMFPRARDTRVTLTYVSPTHSMSYLTL